MRVTPTAALRRRWEERIRPAACSECFDWFDRGMSLNESVVTPDAPTCPIRGKRCVRYCGVGRIIR